MRMPILARGAMDMEVGVRGVDISGERADVDAALAEPPASAKQRQRKEKALFKSRSRQVALSEARGPRAREVREAVVVRVAIVARVVAKR